MRLLVLIGVLAFLGSSMGDGESGDTQGTGDGATSTSCLHVPDNELERSTTADYIDLGVDCLASDTSVRELSNFTTIDEFRQFLNFFCDRVPVIKQCIANVTSLSKGCQNQTNHQIIEIVFDMMNSGFVITCRQGGDNFANLIFQGLQETSAEENNIFNHCLIGEDSKGKLHQNLNADASTKTLIFYRHFKSAKDCLVNATEGDDLKSEMRSYMDEFLSAMKCISPEDKSIVLCATIDHN